MTVEDYLFKNIKYFMVEKIKISLALPTYNRVKYLDLFFDHHRYFTNYGIIPVIISDNASQDGTKALIEARKRERDNLLYYHNENTIPPDENFEKVLGYADTDYVWLLGDTYLIPEETFKAALAATAEDDYDVILFNVADRVTDVPEQVYTDRSKLLADLGWHMTCIGSAVYNSRLIQSANFVRYRDTNFLQTGIIFEYLADKPFKVKWLPQYSVQGLKIPGVKKTSWQAQTFEIWTKRWANFVFSLPASYSLESKLKCAMDHGDKSGVLKLKALIRLRKRNYLNLDVYSHYFPYFPLTIGYPSALIRLIAILPSWLFRVI